MGSKAYEEEALRKDGEASVLETTLNHNNETIERLKMTSVMLIIQIFQLMLKLKKSRTLFPKAK